jgi:hypothetical protein
MGLIGHRFANKVAIGPMSRIGPIPHLDRLQRLPLVFKAFVSRRFPLLIGLPAVALLATGAVLRADDPPAPTPPPGYKVVYHDNGGKKMPIFVKNQARHQQRRTPLRRRSARPAKGLQRNQSRPEQDLQFRQHRHEQIRRSRLAKTFATKVYGDTGPNSVYNLGSKSTYHTSSYDGTKAAPGYNQAYATKSAAGPEPRRLPVRADRSFRTKPHRAD